MAASAAFVLLLSACARHKIIPDDTLAQIFHDAFLTNAYIGSEGVKTDSLRIYEPIFARYGYTTDDVHYTIGNFSKRKSARLGDVVERAIEMLEREGKIYNQEVAVLDTIDNVAPPHLHAHGARRFAHPRRVAARHGRLSFTLDVEPGEYSLSLKYLVDSLDRNQRGLKGSVWLERRDSSRTNVYTTTLRRNREESFSRPVYDRHDAPPPAHRLPDLQRQARTAFGDGHRPQGGVHSPDPHGRRKTLRTATRHPDFRR